MTLRLINKSSTPDHHGIDIVRTYTYKYISCVYSNVQVMTDVDHTTQRLLELLIKRKEDDQTRRLPCIPVIILMPAHIDEDIKQHVLDTGGFDVILQQPVTAKVLFATVVQLLHQRNVVESTYSGLRKQHISTKYPHLQIFTDEKNAQRAGSGDEDDDDSVDTESVDGGGRGALMDVEVDENYTTADLHPASINELRNHYSKTLKRRTYTSRSLMLAGARPVDLKILHSLDKHIIKSILTEHTVGTHINLRDDTDSDDEVKR